MSHRLVRLVSKLFDDETTKVFVILKIQCEICFLGNTPPDYRQTDMDLSDNEENSCEFWIISLKDL